MKLGYGLLAKCQLDPWENILWTTGGESSITLMLVFLRLSRRQRVNAFRAALEAEYAGKVAAGTMARWLPVLALLLEPLGNGSEKLSTYKIIPVGVPLALKNGMKA